MRPFTVMEYAYLCRDVYEGTHDQKIPVTSPTRGCWDIFHFPKQYQYSEPTPQENAEALDMKSHLKNPNALSATHSLEKYNEYRWNHPLESSFFARTYALRTGECIVAIRGTVPSMPGDGVADADIILDHQSGHVGAALNYFQTVRNKINEENARLENEDKNNPPGKKNKNRFSIAGVTGHSLGGFLAQIVADRNHTPCVTFNSPQAGNRWIKTQEGDFYIDASKPHIHFRNICEKYDVIHRIGHNLGPRIVIENSQHLFNLISGNIKRHRFHFEAPAYLVAPARLLKETITSHSIDRVIEDLKHDPSVANLVV